MMKKNTIRFWRILIRVWISLIGKVLKKKSILLTQDYLEYSSQNDRYMYRYEDKSDTRIKKVVFLFFNDSIKLGNLYKIDFEAFWHNGKKYLERESIGSYRFEWRKSYETCSLFGKD